MAALRIGVMGAGSIGAYVGGRLAASGADVALVGRPWLEAEIQQAGLTVRAFGDEPVTVGAASLSFSTDASALADCDVVLVCVKSAHTAGAGQQLAPHLHHAALVVSLQNGVGNAEALREALPVHQVTPGIVGFNVVASSPATFHRTTAGPLVLGPTPQAPDLDQALRRAGFEVERHKDIVAAQWSKLLINLNNAVIALCDTTTPGIIRSAAARKTVAVLVEEGLRILRAAGIRPRAIFGIPIGVIPTLLRLPTWLVKIVARTQINPDPRARSSMWEDLNRRRITEVDYLNGEIVRRAEAQGLAAPYNQRVVELVKDAEAAGLGPVGMSPETLWQHMQDAARAT